MEMPIWTPSAARIAGSNWQDFIHTLQRRGIDIGTDLYAWSIRERELFWSELVHYLHLPISPWDKVLSHDGMPGAVWFQGATLNYAQALLQAPEHGCALIAIDERGLRRELSFAELARETARLCAFFQRLDLRPGDRVATILPVGVDAAIAYLAAASLGLIHSSCSPDFGLQGLYDRLHQIQARVLIASPETFYAGQRHAHEDKIRQLKARLEPSTQLLWSSEPQAGGEDSHEHRWADLPYAGARPPWTAQAFAHPLCILFTSGTTGVPKCIVHGAGGTLLQHLKELSLHTDLHAGDRLLFYTTTGWMMWNWILSALALGVTLVLYDGAPFAPDQRLWDLVDAEKLTHLGAGAKYYAECEKRQLSPRHTHDLRSLRGLLSTGSPLAHESFDYLYREVGRDIAVQSISGGTDIISCFALGRPTQPIYRGQLQGPGLGMDVCILDGQGQDVGVGVKGELCCRQSFPSMPLGFWGDGDGQRYRRAYFERFEHIWAHGDFAESTAEGGLIIHGRSDAVLNPGGVRIGTAEIYRQVEHFSEVLESLAVGQPDGQDERILLFVCLRPGLQLDAGLQQALRSRLRQQASPRHVPALILQAPALPRTRSGKLAELAVKQTLQGRPVENLEALANPESLDWFKNLPALQAARVDQPS